jgi:hypothetical protein
MSRTLAPINPFYTGIAIGYKNKSLIADLVLPRIQVGLQQFKYFKYATADSFTLPDTRVGRKSAVNQVEFGATESTNTTEDYGLSDLVPYSEQKDSIASQTQHDPVAKATEYLTDLIALDREVRASNLVFNSANYGVNTSSLAGANQWSAYATSDPINDILTAKDKCLLAPNIAVIGQKAWTTLRQHPKVAKAINGTSGDVGVVARQALADLLELEQILVGTGFVNTAKPGQTPTLVRVWGNDFSLFHQNLLADNQRGATFGFTAQYDERVARSAENVSVGLRGATEIVVGESVKELIVAPEAGYLLKAVIA